MVVDLETETSKPPTKKENKWVKMKREVLFWTTLTANLITIFYFIYKLIKITNGC